jgi:ABC-type glycerol-3-phosphate transport system substrate-binding protein
MKRGVLLIVGLVFLVLFGLIVFFFARSGSQKTVSAPVLKVWAPFNEKKVYDEIAQDFLAANPGVTLDFKYVEAPDAKEYEAKVVDAIASGTGPDVWLIRTDWLPKHAPKLVTMPKGLGWSLERGEKEPDGLNRIFSPAVIKQNSYQGALYGLPIAVDSLALYINGDKLDKIKRELNDADVEAVSILDEYPKTWADLEAWVRLITKKNKTTITQPAIALGTVSNTYAATDIYTAMLSQYQGNIYNTPTEVALHLALGDGSTPAVRALELYNSFSNPNSPNYTWNDTLGDPVRQFATDQLPMLFAYSTLEPELLRIDSEIGNITVVPFPQQNKIVLPTDERTDFAAYWTHVVPKASPNQALAWEFIKSIVSEGNQSKYAEKTLKSSYLDVSQNDTAKIDETSLGGSSVFPRQVFNAPAVLKPDWQFVDGTLQTMLEAVRTGALSAQAAVDTAAQKLKDGQ